ncbi:MAG: hypothetical protein GC168_17630 [Candidatus Hydrogenedens sp.]|nr:hypothetical protein [Candidatus Hydrogenedens sp.]
MRAIHWLWIVVIVGVAPAIAPHAEVVVLKGAVELCGDGIDNDQNGFTDCDDFACSNSQFCTGETSCGDGIDNDENGFTDCGDFNCANSQFCTGETSCNDGIDNDENGFTDCDDFNCAGEAICTMPLLICPEGAAHSQPPLATTSQPGFSDESDNGLRAFDNFSGLAEPIAGIVWWGGGITPNACTRNPDTFEIAFFQNSGGQPGTLVAAETVVSAASEATGSDAGFGELRRYEYYFDEPVTLASGWVSVYGTGGFQGCFFYWANGDDGDNNAFSSGFGSQGVDFAFCLITARHSADQNDDGIISIGELLRVIQFYNAGGLHCAAAQQITEDGFVPGASQPDQGCRPHDSDYNLQDWIISLSELLRLIQLYNNGGYVACPEDDTSEDGYCSAV